MLPKDIDRSARYAKSITAIPALTVDEEIALFLRWRDHGDMVARDKLIATSLKVAVAMSRKYQARHNDFDELVSAGSEGVMHALTKFDPSRGKKFSAYAWNWVRAYIGIVMIENWSITGGKGIMRSSKLYTLIKVRRRVQATTNDKDDVVDRIAAELKTSPDQVVRWINRMDMRDASLDYMFEDGRCLYDTLHSGKSNPEVENLEADRLRYLRHRIDLAMAHLSQRQKDIMVRRYMSDDSARLQAIGDEQGITRERVRQIEVSALDKLRDHIVVDGNRSAKRVAQVVQIAKRRPAQSKPSLKCA